MKKILSVFLAILIMVTSCVCALNVFAVEPCQDHVVETWENNNTKNHIGTCKVCGERVKEAHILVKGEKEDPTCTMDGYTHYSCKCGYYEYRDTVNKTGHNIISTTYNYDLNGDGIINDHDVKYEKTTECTHKYIDKNGVEQNCAGEKTTGAIGNSNYCTECGEYTLLSKTIVHATCRTVEYVVYRCSNTECDSEYKKYGRELLDCNYVLEVTPATCIGEGCNKYTCTMCGDSYNDTLLPARGHKIDRAGTETIYTYEKGKCEIIGYCSVCTEPGTVTYTEKHANPEKCVKCNAIVNTKKVKFPANCEEAITIKTKCANDLCSEQEITTLPVGHEAITTTYEYHDNGKLKSVVVDCAKCGENQPSEGGEFNTANTCVICSSIIEKRVIVAPTCEENGYTKVTCPECGVYTESTKKSVAHNSTFAEWKFDRASGTYTFRANCTNSGCSGYTFNAAIGIAGRCARCGKDALESKREEYSDCAFNGYTNAGCTYCGSYSDYDIKTVLPHDTISTYVEATCETGSATKSTCVDCYYTVETSETAPLGHIGGVESIVFKDGKKITSGWCDRCDDNYEVTETVTDDDKLCSKCKQSNLTKIIKVKPDCKSGSSGYTRIYCSTCVYYDTDIIPATHNFGEWTVISVPTCVETGLRVRTCENCSSIEEDTIAPNQTTTGEPKHKYVVVVKGKEATCTKPGLSDEMYCSSCGDYQRSTVTEPLGHLLDTEGKNKNFCDRCDTYIIGEGTGAVSCSCMCHNSDGLAKFFFKFILFFSQIFGINKSCACGTIHY